MHRSPSCFALVLAAGLSACGLPAEDDATASRESPLGISPPILVCGGLTEQQCAQHSTTCEAVYSGGICPLGACSQTSCPPCPPPAFTECRTRCSALDEVACTARSDCQAEYAREVCPASACRPGTECPPCVKRFTGCSVAPPRTGGGSTASGVGSAAPGSAGP